MEFVIILLVLAVVVAYNMVAIVPQGFKFIVQRWGKYNRTLTPGINWIIPFMDKVAFKVTTKDIVLDIPSQEVITLDNAVIIMNAVSYINITSPEKAVYGIEDYAWAIQNLVQTTLRSIVGEMALDDALSSRDHIKAKLKAAISDDIADWGITLKTVEIQDIKPSSTMQLKSYWHVHHKKQLNWSLVQSVIKKSQWHIYLVSNMSRQCKICRNRTMPKLWSYRLI